MKNKFLSKLGITIIAFATIILGAGTVKGFAADNTDSQNPVGGLVQHEVKIIELTEDPHYVDVVVLNPKTNSEKAVDALMPVTSTNNYELNAEKEYWNKFSGHFYYDQLNANQKIVWDAAREGLVNIMINEDAPSSITFDITNLSLTEEELQFIGYYFDYSNPQFFFSDGCYAYSYDGKVYVGFQFMREYCVKSSSGWYSNKLDREKVSKDIKDLRSLLDTWIPEAEEAVKGLTGKERELALEMILHDRFCDNVVYDQAAVDGTDDDYERTSFDQSATSGLLYGTTVCAGYAKGLAILLNGVGINTECFSTYVATPEFTGGRTGGHAWNMVEIGGKWYLVDATWNDMDEVIYRSYYNVSLDTAGTNDTEGFHSQKNLNAVYKTLVPICNSNDLTATARLGWDGLDVQISGTNVTIESSQSYINYAIYSGTPNAAKECDTSYTSKFSFNLSSNECVNLIRKGAYYANSRVITFGPAKVIFNANGAKESAPATITTVNGAEVSLPTSTLTKDGYLFWGWNTEADGSGSHYDAGESTKYLTLKAGGSVTLYAEWAEPVYYINYHSTYSSTSEMEKTVARIGEATQLRKCTFERTGYYVKAWNTKEDRTGTSYPADSLVTDLTTEVRGKVDLYTEWAPIEYKYTYVLNGGTFEVEPKYTYTYADTYFRYSVPKREGYTFEGWYTEETFENLVEGHSSYQTGDKTIYAKWTPCTYDIIFAAYSNTYWWQIEGNMDYQTCEYGQEYKLSKNTYTRKGYIFKGWSTEEGGKVIYEDEATIKDFSTGYTVYLYPIWEVDPDYEGDSYVVVDPDDPGSGTGTGGTGGSGSEDDPGCEIIKADNKIYGTAKYTKTGSTKSQSFYLDTWDYSYSLKYKSSDSKIKISTTGKVTIPKNYVGKFTVTVTGGNDSYKTVTKKITVVVNPAKLSFKTVKSSKKGQLSLSWAKKTNVTGYQIQYSTDSTFKKSTKTVTVSKYSTVSKTVNSLKGGKYYYVRIRAYKTVGSSKLYSSWSTAKKIKIKK